MNLNQLPSSNILVYVGRWKIPKLLEFWKQKTHIAGSRDFVVERKNVLDRKIEFPVRDEKQKEANII